MIATLILATAVALIAVQPLLVRTWPWLDQRNRPRRTLLDILHEEALKLPIPPPPAAADAEYRTALEQGVPLAEAQARRRGGIVPAGWGYDYVTDSYRDVATGMTASRAELDAGLGNAADVRFQQQLACAVADGHTQTEANLRALHGDMLSADLQMRAAQRDLDRRLSMANDAANAARGMANLWPRA